MRVGNTVLFFLAATSLFAARPAHATYLREPWVNDLGKDHAAIYWEGAPFGSGPQTMQWGPGSSLTNNATGVNVSGSVYKVDLTGLSPSTSYSFKVTSNTDVSAVGTFGTAPTDGSTEPFRFGIYGDNRTNATDHASVVAGLKNMSPDFVLNTGDLADTITTFNYLEFFSIEKALLYHTAIFPAPGNHDLGSIYQGGFDRPNWYSFRWGNAFFVSISASGADSYASGSTQYNWIEQQLSTAHADPTIQWLFVYHHFPVYSSDTTHGSTADMQTSLNPLYKQYGVDAVFNGHSHTYERDEKDGIEYYVVGGGGAPLYSLGSAVAGQQYAASTLSFLVADVNGGSLDLKAYKPDGTMIDSKHLDKGTAPTPTPTGTGTTPTPNPSGTPGGNGANGGGCDVAAVGVGASPALFVLGLFGLALARRRRRA